MAASSTQVLPTMNHKVLPGGFAVSNLDGAVDGARDEPLVPGLERNATHPPEMPRHHRLELPRCVPSRCWDLEGDT